MTKSPSEENPVFLTLILMGIYMLLNANSLTLRAHISKTNIRRRGRPKLTGHAAHQNPTPQGVQMGKFLTPNENA